MNIFLHLATFIFIIMFIINSYYSHYCNAKNGLRYCNVEKKYDI